MAKETRKDILKAPDEFKVVMDRSLKWIKTHMQTFIITVIIVFGLVSASLGFYSWKANRQIQAFEMYFSNGQAKKMLVEKYPDTVAGRLAMLRLAAYSYAKGDLKDTEKWAQEFLNKWNKKDIFYYEALLILSCKYMDSGDVPKAIGLLDKCIESAPEGIKNQALFYKGIALKNTGKDSEAAGIFKKIGGQYKYLAEIYISDMGQAKGNKQHAR